MADCTFRCQCGELQGTLTDISADTGNRLVCYCDDCQAFANYLEKEGKWLDQWGGTDLFQLAPSQINITQGHHQMRCVHLSAKGPYRFYTACCATPIGNTVSRKIPFVGMPTAIIDSDNKQALLGAVKFYIMGRFAKGNPPTNPHSKFSLSSLIGVMKLIIKNKIKGNNVPTPFFNEDGLPVCPISRFNKSDNNQ